MTITQNICSVGKKKYDATDYTVQLRFKLFKFIQISYKTTGNQNLISI